MFSPRIGFNAVTNIQISDFELDLLTKDIDWVIDEYIFGGDVYVYRDSPVTGDILLSHLAETLEVITEDVRIVGSAKIGFSLSPDNYPRRFSVTSDVDVVIVNEELFDRIWTTILRWHYPRRRIGFSGANGDWMRGRRKDVYWGSIYPEKIKYRGLYFPEALAPLRDISTRWFNAFRSLSRKPEFADRNVSGRLYRTWDHARLYHTYGLLQIKGNLTPKER